MRALVTTLVVLLTLGIAVGGLPAESAAAQATLGCPATVQAGAQFVTEVTIDVGTTPLGAYEIAVTYDPAVLTVASVAGGSTAQFSGSPTTNTPTPGTTNISAFQSASLTMPTGVVSVAMITFNVAATASAATAIGLTVKTLFDTNSGAILPATGTGCSVSVTGTGSTTTSTTSTTIATSTTTTTGPRPSTSTSTTTTRPATTTTTVPPTTTTRPPTTTTRPPTTTSSTSATTTTSTTTTSTTTRTQGPTTTTTSTTTPTTTTRPTTTSTTTTTTRPTTITTSSSTSSTTSPTATTSISTTTTTAPPTTDQCPEGLGFWKNHPELWPVSSLTLGSQAYAQAELLTLLTSPVAGDASVLLAHQLIAAKLNIANGSDPTPIASTIADADGLLSGFAGKLPDGVAPSSVTGGAMVHDASILTSFNDGASTPTCSTTATDEVLQPTVRGVAGQLDAIEAACSGERVPRGLQRRLERARRLLARAGARGGQGAEVLLRRAARQLRGGVAVATRAARSGRVSSECPRMLRSALAGGHGGRASR